MNRTLLSFLLLSWVLSGCNDLKPVDVVDSETPPPASSLLDLLDDSSGTTSSDANYATPVFLDVAQERGIDFSFFSDTVPGRFYLPEVMGGGVAWIDFDRDGYVDIYLANGSYLAADVENTGEHTNRLYRNVRGQFVDISDGSGATFDLEYGQGVAVGDYDADGFEDIFVANYGRNKLYRNQGDGTFTEVTLVVGISDRSQWSSSTLWLDVDRDNDLDLYVLNYMDVRQDNYKICRYNGIEGYCGPGEYQAVDDQVYLNQGDGTFIESANELGLVAENGKGLAITAMDFDLDLVPEIYVANDMTPNFLFSTKDPFNRDTQNNKTQDNTTAQNADGQLYQELGVFSGTAASDVGQPEASMGIASGDFNTDGLPDIFLTHFYSHKNTLYRNRGGLVFTDESKTSNVARTSYETLGFGTVSLDYDLDGAVDLFIANGHVLGPNHPPYQMQPQLLRNDGQGQFKDLTPEIEGYFQGTYLGRGAAGADFDNDGDLDIGVTHIGSPFALLENDTDDPHQFIGFDLATESRIHPVGTRVEVSYDEKTHVFCTSAGGSYLSDPDRRVLIGIGNHQGPVDVKILWSDGEISELADMGTQRYWRVQANTPPIDLSQLAE